MANKEQLSNMSAALQAISEAVEEMIHDSAAAHNHVLAALLAGFLNHGQYIQASVVAAIAQAPEEKRHPLDIWKRDSQN